MIYKKNYHRNDQAAAKSLAAFFALSLSLGLSLILLCQCESEKNVSTTTSPAELQKYSFSEPHLGTIARIVFYSSDTKQAAELSQKCFQRIRKLNAVFSDYKDDSEVSELCQKPVGEAHKVSDPLFSVIAQAQTISEKTNGAFDITLGKHTQRWRARSAEELDEININYRHLKLDHQQKTITLLKPLKIDLGGIAKGYIADQLMVILKDAGLKHAAVIIGGETVLADAPPEKRGWRIGIENPEKKVIGTLVLANTSLSTSGDSYQFFEVEGERQSHLIDPKTKKNKINRLNVTTIAPTAMQADAWATALRILSTDNAISIANKQPNLEALFIPFQKATLKTEQFPKIEETKL